jgi:hypothetical protein
VLIGVLEGCHEVYNGVVEDLPVPRREAAERGVYLAGNVRGEPVSVQLRHDEGAASLGVDPGNAGVLKLH